MNTDQVLIDALTQTIKAQSELISYLKAEVERLKLSPKIDFNPPSPGTGTLQPSWPWTQPYQPYIVSSSTPGYPYTVTSSLSTSQIGSPVLGSITASSTTFTKDDSFFDKFDAKNRKDAGLG